MRQLFPDGSILEFFADDHRYELHREGKPMVSPVSVSTIANYEDGQAEPFYPPGASYRGTTIHRALELLERGELDPTYFKATKDLRIGEFLRVYPQWLVEMGYTLVDAEMLLWGEVDGIPYVGTCDRIYQTRDRLRHLTDLKTSPRKSPAHPRQVVAYCEAYQQRYGLTINQVSSTHLCEKAGKVTIQQREIDDEEHARAFAGFTERLKQCQP